MDQQYATPAHNDTVADYEFIASKLGQEAANQYLSGMGDPIVTVPLPGGQIYSGPRSGMAQALGGAAPQRPVGKLTPIEPTIGTTPAPELGANGFPTVLTQQQYQATVASMGKAATDAWMQRNNIRIGN